VRNQTSFWRVHLPQDVIRPCKIIEILLARAHSLRKKFEDVLPGGGSSASSEVSVKSMSGDSRSSDETNEINSQVEGVDERFDTV
jgi:hypothetical protein